MAADWLNPWLGAYPQVSPSFETPYQSPGVAVVSRSGRFASWVRFPIRETTPFMADLVLLPAASAYRSGPHDGD